MPIRNIIPSGTLSLDEALGGGIAEGDILHIYGPGGVGKTTLALQFAINVALRGNRVFYVNCEGIFPLIRLKQLASTQFSRVAPLITIVSPKSFNEQAKLVSNLDSIISSEVKLLVFDTIVSHYRREYSPSTDSVMLNRKLNQQFGLIANAARIASFAVIAINQVRGNNSDTDHFVPVAESVTSYWGSFSLRINKTESKGYREFKLMKRGESEAKILLVSLQLAGFR